MSQLGGEHLCHSARTLRKDLVRVPLSLDHYVGDSLNVIVGNTILEKVTHRVDENHFWLVPSQRFAQLLGDQSKVETLFVWMSFNSAKPFSENFGIAVFASRANFRATAHGIPS